MFGTFPHCNSHKLWKRSTVRSLNDIVLSAKFYSNKAKLHFAKTSNVCSFVRENCAFPRRKRHRREESAESALPNNLVRKKSPIRFQHEKMVLFHTQLNTTAATMRQTWESFHLSVQPRDESGVCWTHTAKRELCYITPILSQYALAHILGGNVYHLYQHPSRLRFKT